MNDHALQRLVRSFNQRHYDKAVDFATDGLATSQGRDEAFWMGLHDACEGYAHIDAGKLDRAEAKLTQSMQKLRNFGFRYKNFEVTAALAGIRRAVEEIRAVKASNKRTFDVSLLPQLKLAAKADD